MGDEKPSIFLQRLRNLAVGQVTNEILKSIFMEQLPENVRSILEISEVQDLAKLAAQADKIVEVTKPASTTVQAVSGRQDEVDNKILQTITELESQIKKFTLRDRSGRRSRSRERSKSRERPGSQARLRKHSDKEVNTSKDYCYYHNRFGDEAYKCTQPCTYNKPKAVGN